ncbi:amidase [Domibacillus antri]|uniref:Amidase n=1 Tax=Domibacillus antri TaxID=1714264 RepID=A0A1Q8Q3M8_9BACI|nr:amidase domain-containing protein [Domibacillus antri]OLN21963.1 amidase [Domibacillus antri]
MYNREAAVDYAQQWWNSYNPGFPRFAVDCTNYISQCLLAGGAPMRGYPNRGKGWWIRGGTWSYSWSVSHSLRWYLEGSTLGLKAKKVSSPDLLMPGDIIFYDFAGDGRIDHSTIVTGKQGNSLLVNAHTMNSRNRLWSYENSTAYTPSIKYLFFHIEDNMTL